MNRRPSLPAEIYTLVERSPGAVLLEFAGAPPRLFAEPMQVLRAETAGELGTLFGEIERAVAGGLFVAGYFSYECGQVFEPSAAGVAAEADCSEPLAWFGVYAEARILDEAVDDEGSVGTGAGGVECSFSLTKDAYGERIREIHEWIRRGDVYQLNFTVPIQLQVHGGAAALYENLRHSQPAPYSAFLQTERGQHILSLSPELFFRMDDGETGRRITTRPMKGTARRGRTTAEDRAQAQWLTNDAKNRAENVMIVDLLRNDLGRLCEFGSVTASDLFAVERYPTLWQMTSTICGAVRADVGFQEIFRALFPCGSITGAPKVRAMQLIEEMEGRRRGVYTGAIGYFSKESSVFNVAIRTVSLRDGRGTMGVGSGVVIDSDPAAEWEECQLKAAFLTSGETQPAFSLVETLLWDGGYPLLELHLDRLEDSAAYFEFPFCRGEVRAAFWSFGAGLAAGARKVRLLLDRRGKATIGCEAICVAGERPLRVCVSEQRTDPQDRFYFHKTTHRPLYTRELRAAIDAGYDEVLFVNCLGEVTEGAIHNVFVVKDGRLLTPPMDCGVLPGVYRRHLLETEPNAGEAVLTLKDLRKAEGIVVCNAVRGLQRAEIDWDCVKE